jgi:hypothetical protein
MSICSEQLKTNIGDIKSTQMFMLEELKQYILAKDPCSITEPVRDPGRGSTVNMYDPLAKMDQRMAMMEQSISNLVDVMMTRHGRRDDENEVRVTQATADPRVTDKQVERLFDGTFHAVRCQYIGLYVFVSGKK